MKKQPVPFGKYFLLDRINIGGMAEVWKGKTYGVEGFEKIVAIKRILPNIAEDEEFITMFIDEAKISVQLTHANVAQTFDLGKISESYYIAMEYISGKDLRAIFDRMRKKGEVIPIPMTCYIMSRVCEGLDYAHRKRDAAGRELGIVHRDVSPQNALISFDGEVKVIDFGIAKAANKATKTQAGILKGKFGYMSPEQVRGLPLDRRSDVFAIGVVLYEMLTGERLFVGESDFSTLEKVRNVDILPPTTYNRRIPEPLERIVLKALAKDVEDRYQWANELQDDLQRFLITSDAIFSRKDLAQYMKSTFAEDVEREKIKMAEAAEIKLPAHMGGLPTAAAPTPAAERSLGSDPAARAQRSAPPAARAPAPGRPAAAPKPAPAPRSAPPPPPVEAPSPADTGRTEIFASNPYQAGAQPAAEEMTTNPGLSGVGGPPAFDEGDFPIVESATVAKAQRPEGLVPVAPRAPMLAGPPPGFAQSQGGGAPQLSPARGAPVARQAEAPPTRGKGLLVGIAVGVGGVALGAVILAGLYFGGVLGGASGAGGGQIIVSASDEVVEIRVDGVPVATKAPFSSMFPIGDHKVQLKSADGRVMNKDVVVMAGDRALVDPKFQDEKPVTVFLVVVPQPGEAEVLLDQKVIKAAGPGAPPTVDVEVGEHTVTVRAPGFVTEERKLSIKAGDRTPPLTIQLQPGPSGGAESEVGSEPSGATIVLDGAEQGVTPKKLALDPAKEHKLVLKLKCHKDEEVTVAAGASPAAYTPKLTKIAGCDDAAPKPEGEPRP